MHRVITGYHIDDVGDLVAELDCGHGQHMRHKPPLFLRAWVTTPEGRASMIGTALDCIRCDRFEIPEHFEAYKRTPEFDEASIPQGLKKSHTTRAGVWARIHVLAGRLIYRIESKAPAEFALDPQTQGVVIPEVPHHVQPDGPVRFYVEFHRRRSDPAPNNPAP